MATLKDKGNDEFKKNNFQKAIQYYNQYVEHDNKDNQLAYTNMAMCYFKLKDYHKTIQACQNALSYKKEQPKPHYRLYLTYKEMPDQEYGVFINAYLFLKYYTEDNQSAKAQALSIMREFKDKFISKKTEEGVKFDQGIIKDLESLTMENTQKIIEQPGTIFEWEEYLRNQQTQLKQKCQKIEKIAQKQYSFGINLAYMLLNKCHRQQDKNFVKQKIIKIKKQQKQLQKIQQKQIQKVPAEQQSKMNEQSQENLFESQPERPQKTQQQKTLPNQNQQSKINQQGSLKIDDKKIVQEKPQQNHKVQQVKYQFVRKGSFSLQQIDSQINLLLKKLQSSRDMFNDINQNIVGLLNSYQSIQIKRLYLQKLSKKCHQIKYIKISLSQNDQRKIYTLLVKNNLQDLSQIYAPKGK